MNRSFFSSVCTTTLTLAALHLGGCVADTGEATRENAGSASESAALEGAAKPDLFLGPPALSVAPAGEQVTFTGTGFTPDGLIEVAIYELVSGRWTIASPSIQVTATPTICTSRFCYQGGAISGTLPWTGGCASTVTLRALDSSTQNWTSAPFPWCDKVDLGAETVTSAKADATATPPSSVTDEEGTAERLATCTEPSRPTQACSIGWHWCGCADSSDPLPRGWVCGFCK